MTQKLDPEMHLLRPAPAWSGHYEGQPLPPGAIAGYDNGVTVYLDMNAGGAHKHGEWSHLALRFVMPEMTFPNGRVTMARDTRRLYTADDVRAWPVGWSLVWFCFECLCKTAGLAAMVVGLLLLMAKLAAVH